MMGAPAAKFFTPEDRRAGVPQAEMTAALEKGRGSDERWHLKKDGNRFWANGEMMPLKDDAGLVQGFIKILRDRTAQRLAAEVQRADAEFLRGILASSGDCIKVLDLEGRVTFMNDGGVRLMEVEDIAAVSGSAWTDFWPGPPRPEILAALQSARAGSTGRFQGAAPTFRGVEKFWDVQVTPILDAEGRPERLLAVSRDISARRRVEEALAQRVDELRESERRVRELNETLEQRVQERTRERDRIWHVSHDMLGVSNADRVWLSINPAWQRILGWAYDEVVGKNTDWLLHPDDLALSRQQTLRLASGLPLSAFENRYRAKDGSYRTLAWTSVPVEGLFYSVARDITDERAQQEALAKAEEALRQAQKMDALGQLTGGIAHDFNNLLTGIIGSLDIVRRRLGDGRVQDVPRFMDAASASAQRAAALTHRLLAFARRQSLDTKPSDVNALVAGMEDLLRRTLGEQVSLHTDLSLALWPAMADDNQLENAILNLAINARDAMPDGGTLTIETANIHLDHAYAALHDDVTAGDYVMVAVSDTGTGMPPDVVEKAFDPFFTTKPLGEGTGLGLSMIYGFVKQSAGHVRLYSEMGVGTSMKIFLPRAEAAEAGADESAGEVPMGQGETVLVVEDDAAVRLIITEVLDELGYRHLSAADFAIA
jgi:PAS domain S-box-containing protein